MKKCVKCGEMKQLGEFYRRDDSRDGYRNDCKACRCASVLAYKEVNRDKVLAGKRAHRLANKDRYREWNRAWLEANRDRVVVYNRTWRRANLARAHQCERRWRQSNPLKNREGTRRYLARKRAAIVEDVDYARVLREYGPVCSLCGDAIPLVRWPHPLSLTFDHVIPLARGGAHSEQNIRPAHFVCNASKGASSLAG